jgi:hypothetical protein
VLDIFPAQSVDPCPRPVADRQIAGDRRIGGKETLSIVSLRASRAPIDERVRKISTRRFLARALASMFGATGFALPKPLGLMADFCKPCEASQLATAWGAPLR